MNPIAYQLTDRLLSRVAFPLLHPRKHARNQNARSQKLRTAGVLPAGSGIFHRHISLGLTLDFQSVCGVALNDIGGPMSDATCPRCIRIARHAGVWDASAPRARQGQDD